jgi:uncharacterized membrane protein
MKYILLLLIALINSSALLAQTATPATETDFMNSNGKIYVVMVVVLIILIGLFLFIYSVDKKISQLEKQL